MGDFVWTTPQVPLMWLHRWCSGYFIIERGLQLLLWRPDTSTGLALDSLPVTPSGLNSFREVVLAFSITIGCSYTVPRSRLHPTVPSSVLSALPQRAFPAGMHHPTRLLHCILIMASALGPQVSSPYLLLHRPEVNPPHVEGIKLEPFHPSTTSSSKLARQLDAACDQLHALTRGLQVAGVLAIEPAAGPSFHSCTLVASGGQLGCFLSLLGSGVCQGTGLPVAPAMRQSLPALWASLMFNLPLRTPNSQLTFHSAIANVDAIVVPSDSDLAHTTTSCIGDIGEAAVPFDHGDIPAVQRKVAALLQGVDVERAGVPFMTGRFPHYAPLLFTTLSPAALRVNCLWA